MIPHREQTRRILVGTCPVGGGSRISIQSMTNTITTDVEATVSQINAFVQAGCDIVRVSVPDGDSVRAFGEIRKRSLIPVIADIHFDHRLAIGAMAQGADAIRINPGNIGGREKLKAVARAAMDRGVPMRVGVNLGSVGRSLLARYGDDHVGAIVESGRQHVEMLEDLGVKALKVSLKSSDVLETIDAYRRFSQVSDWPLHLGVTEAGPLVSGLIRSSVGMGVLLEGGIGDTIRVSLSADPVQEVFAGRILLECLGLRAEGIRVIACPTCARACADVAAISSELEDALKNVRRHMVVAVMGCVVNGPGEAKLADLGVACDARGAVLFARGRKVRRIGKNEIITTIVNEIHKEKPS
jgi:(E)-4-hydroxy-3-methylbut-2-enyl-diphosphate synthase